MGVIEYASGLTTTNGLFGGMTTILTAYVGVIVLVVILPFAASLILDGVVHLFRGRGLGPLMIGVAFTIVVAVAGVIVVSYGQPEGGPAPATLAGMKSLTDMLLPFSVGLAIIAFVFRMVSMLLNKSRPARRQA